MIVVNDVTDIVGKVIRAERPYVKILSTPRLEVYEGLPGVIMERWEAVAQVDGTLAVISLSVVEQR